MSFVGIDVSKNVLDVHVLCTGEHWQVGNDQINSLDTKDTKDTKEEQ